MRSSQNGNPGNPSIPFTLPPVEVTLGVTHPASRGWAEALRRAFDAHKPVPPRDWEAVCAAYVGWEKYLSVTEVAVGLTLAGWKVNVRNAYSFSAEKEGDGFWGETKAQWVEGKVQQCWSFSRKYDG